MSDRGSSPTGHATKTNCAAQCCASSRNFAPFGKISEHFASEARLVGGSLFHIHHDTRVTKNKTPYKTHAGAYFRQVRVRHVHPPGFYLYTEYGARQRVHERQYLAPRQRDLQHNSQAIVADPKRWKRLKNTKALSTAGCELVGDKLKHHRGPTIQNIC